MVSAACTAESGPATSRRAITGGAVSADDPAVVPIRAAVASCEAPPELLCTGTVVAPRAVLTAAHCVDGAAASLAVDGAGVAAAFVHPDVADLAVLVLAEPVATVPASLRRAAMTSADVGAAVRVVGYGADDDGVTGVEREGTAVISAVDGDGFSIGPDPAMTCGGDSGGPVFLAGEVAGVVSYGDPECALSGFNTRVDLYAGSFLDPTLAEIAARPPAPDRPALDPEVDYCATDCSSDADCPRGTACVERDGDLRCALGGGDVGVFEGACAADADCGDGVCLRDVEGAACHCFLRCDQREMDGCCSGGGGSGLALVLLVAALAWCRGRAIALLAAMVVSACAAEPGPSGPIFVELTGTGLDPGIVAPDPSDDPCATPPCVSWGPSFGVGGAAADFDGDGRVDLYLAGPDGGRLWANRTPEGGDIALAEVAGLPPSTDYVHGAATGDLDRDGDVDLVLATATGPRLLLNDGTGAFTDRTDALGITREVARSPSVTVGDIDGNGQLDIHVSEYGVPGTAIRGPGLMLLNRGDLVFEDIAAGWPERQAWASLMADLDRDGRLDLFIATETWDVEADEQPSSVLYNDGGDPLVLTEHAGIRDQFERLSTPMGAAAADVDGDGNLEVLVSLMGPSAYMRRATGGAARDLEVASYFGPLGVLEAYQTGWAAALEDFDRDGELEALLIAGAPCLPADCAEIPPSQNPELFELEDRQLDYAHAVRVPDAGGLAGAEGEYRNQRGLILADLGGDGRDELVTTPFNDRFRVYRTGDLGGHYLRVELHGQASAPTPVGAEITVRAGGVVRTRQLTAGGSTHTSHGSGLVFELGDADSYDAVEVRWPAGGVRSYPGGPADRTVVLTE